MDPTISDWFTLLNTGGVVAVLIFNVVMFMQGRIIASKVHDDAMAAVKENTKLLAMEICEKMEESIRKGTLAAHHEINGGKIPVKGG